MNDNYVDDAFEMNDEQLEAELLRQLECLSSEDEEDHDTGDAKTYIKQQSISENNSPNYQILTTPTLSPPPPTDSAWSQLLATMNADTNHWDQYESELTSLRTSMSAVVPRSKETTTTANTTEEPLSPTSNTFFTGVPLPNEDTTNDTDSNTEDEDEDPEKYVKEMQERMKTLLADDEEDNKEEAKPTEINTSASPSSPSSSPFNEDNTTTIHKPSTSPSSSLATSLHNTTTTNNNNNTTTNNPDTVTNFNARANTILHASNTNDLNKELFYTSLVNEAKSNMSAEEIQWQLDNKQHEEALQRDIEMQQEERIIMEREAKIERIQLKKEQERRQLMIEKEAQTRHLEIERHAQEASDRRKEIELAREQQRQREQERMEQFQLELKQADLEREQEMERAKKEEQIRAHVLKTMRVRWTLEERCAKTIQRHVRSRRTGIQVKVAQLKIALYLQKYSRGNQGRKKYILIKRNMKSTVLSKWWKVRMNRIKYIRHRNQMRRNVIAIQSSWRRHVGKRTVQAMQLKQIEKQNNLQQNAATLIASQWKGFVFKREYLDMVAASTIVCSVIRGYLSRSVVQTRRKSVVHLQAIARGWQGRRESKLLQKETIEKRKNEKEVHMAREKLKVLQREKLIQKEEDEQLPDDGNDLFGLGEVEEEEEKDRVPESVLLMDTIDGGSVLNTFSKNEKNGKNYSKRLAPSMPDQILCKENQRRHLSKQQDQWMEERKQEQHKQSNHEHTYMGETKGQTKGQMKGQTKGQTTRNSTINISPSTLVDTSLDENERLYNHWYQRAIQWQEKKNNISLENSTTQSATQSGTQSAAQSITATKLMDPFEQSRRNKIKLQYYMKETLKHTKKVFDLKDSSIKVSSLKKNLITMSRKLRTLKEEKNMNAIKLLVPAMKQLKIEYEDAIKTTEKYKRAVQRSQKKINDREENMYPSTYDYSRKKQFVCNVEGLNELPTEQLTSIGSRLMAVIANANQLSDITELTKLCWTSNTKEDQEKEKKNENTDENDTKAVLEWLSLRDNRLKTLTNVSPLLSTLEYLSIEMNNITSLSHLIQSKNSATSKTTERNTMHQTTTCYPLRTLLASNNQIQSLEPLCCTTNNIDNNIDNNINNINYNPSSSSSFSSSPFQCLETLSMYRNKISEIPFNLTLSLPNLRHLDLGRNQIKHIHQFNLEHCPLLETLILYENQIEMLPTTNNMCLKEIWMNGNQLIDLSYRSTGTSWGPSVETLHLHDNQIESLDRGTLLAYPMLRVLDLSFNKLSSLDDLRELSGCPHITSLKLNDNPLCELPEYRRRVLLALPHLTELDNEIVLASEHDALRTHVYGADSGMIEPWLHQNNEFQRAISVGSQGSEGIEDKPFSSSSSTSLDSFQIDWHEVLRHRGVGASGLASIAWQNFETMCSRQRLEKEKFKLLKRKYDKEETNNLNENGNKGTIKRSSTDPRSVLLSFEHDRLTREMLRRHVEEHRLFQWKGLRSGEIVPGHVVISSNNNKRKNKNMKEKAKVQEQQQPQLQGNRRVIGSRGSSRGSSVSDTGSIRGRTAGEVAVLIQSLWRGHVHRKSPAFFAFATEMCERAMIAAEEEEEEERDLIHNSNGHGSVKEEFELDDMEEDDFGGVDMDGFLGGMNALDIDVDEFDYMQQNSTTTTAKNGQNRSGPATVRTGWLNQNETTVGNTDNNHYPQQQQQQQQQQHQQQ